MSKRPIPAGALVIGAPRHDTVVVRGAEFTMLMNPPLSLLADVDAGGAQTLDALRQLVVAHPIVRPDGHAADIGEVNDLDLLRDILKAWRLAAADLPPA